MSEGRQGHVRFVWLLVVFLLLLLFLAVARAEAQGTPPADAAPAEAPVAPVSPADPAPTDVPADAPPADAPADAPAAAAAAAEEPPPVVLGAYAEASYQWNFRDPSNGITNFRGFDNRHDTFTLSNVAVDAAWDYRGAVGRVTLQVGHTPSTYYLAEPELPGSDGANATGTELWKYVQQAWGGYRFDVGPASGLTVTAGIFLSPIGPESMAVKDDWNWSRSNLFFGLPFYHTGVRATYALDDAWALTVAGYNGWNSVVDNNEDKSVSLQATYTDDRVAFSALYFGGVERATGAPEGSRWRHDFDAHVTWTATDRLAFIAHGNAGFEPNRFGTSAWAAGALYARAELVPGLFGALRGDFFYEEVAEDDGGVASPIFWPSAWVSSATATLDYRPADHVSFRLEYRHDHAEDDTYFGGEVSGDGQESPYVPNRRSQDTITLGVVAWL